MNPTSFQGLVLAGGASRRFGRDKRKEPVDGVSLLAGTVDRLRTVCPATAVSFGDPGSALAVEVPVWFDAWDDAGPLAGIATGFRSSQAEALFVLACDLPHMTEGSLRQIAGEAGCSMAAAVVAAGSQTGRIQPLCGVWRRTLQEPLEQWLGAGKRAVLPFLEACGFDRVSIPERELVNLNRPEDVRLYSR